jgi:cytochrome c peroxidase
MGASQLGIKLADDEIDKITAFLDSLTGEQPQVIYPIACVDRGTPVS